MVALLIYLPISSTFEQWGPLITDNSMYLNRDLSKKINVPTLDFFLSRKPVKDHGSWSWRFRPHVAQKQTHEDTEYLLAE